MAEKGLNNALRQSSRGELTGRWVHLESLGAAKLNVPAFFPRRCSLKKE